MQITPNLQKQIRSYLGNRRHDEVALLVRLIDTPELSIDQCQPILDYLVDRPYRDVHRMIDQLMQESKDSFASAAKEEGKV